MIAYCFYDRPRAYPLARRRDGIVIINGSAAWIPAVKRVARGTVARALHGVLDLSVVHGGKRAGLINNAGYRVRERRVLYPVKDNRPDSDLTFIAFAASFAVYRLGEQRNVV